MQDVRHIGAALPPRTAHSLPRVERGGASCYPGLALLDVDTLCRGVLLPRLQALRGVCEGPFGVPQPTEDGQRIARGPVMAQMTQVRDAPAAQTRVGQLAQCLGPV